MKKLLGIILLVFLLSANANAGSDGQDDLSKNKNGEVKDCFESINRGIFAFNRGLDQIVIEPIAKGYRYLPSPIRTGTSNVLSNLSNVVTIPNNILQGDFKAAGNNTLRFVINITLGIVGIFDVAGIIGFEKLDKEDYGQTLASWGMGPGCYIVLPVLGPSTARDTVGSLTSYLGGDAWYNITVRNDTHYVTDFDYYASKGLEGVDLRAKNIESFNNLEENSIDFYASIKSLYLQNRQQKILNSKKITETQDDSDWEEIDIN